MKRSPLKRGTTWLRRSKPLAARSNKMRIVYQTRAPFVAAFLAENPQCELRLEHCTGAATTVNEVIRRSHGGALYPGQEGKRATQYQAACVNCHDWLTTHPREARERGWEVR